MTASTAEPPTVVLGGRVIADVERLARRFLTCRRETGYDYYSYSTSKTDDVSISDVAVTLGMNSGVTGIAFRTILEHGPAIAEVLGAVPTNLALEEGTCGSAELDTMVELVTFTTNVGRNIEERRGAGLEPFPTGIGVSVATKLLHKKRPDLLPVLDNQAIFISYLGEKEPDWRNCGPAVRRALEAIQRDLRHPSNEAGWAALSAEWPWLTRVELFDIIWWEYDAPRRRLAQRRPATSACLMVRGMKCNASCPDRPPRQGESPASDLMPR